MGWVGKGVEQRFCAFRGGALRSGSTAMASYCKLTR